MLERCFASHYRKNGAVGFRELRMLRLRRPRRSAADRRVGSKRTTPMRQIVAIVRPFVAERVLESLRNAPVEAITVCEVKGFGRQKHYLEEYRGGVYAFAFLPKVEITLWVDDLRAEEVTRMVVQQARSGRMGDGKVFVVASEAVVVDLAAPECGGTDAADPKHPHAKEDDG